MRDSFLAISNMEKPAVTQSISKARSDKIERNRAALTSIIDIIITLGKRNIAFRGNWNKEISEEDGNFMFFINWKATFDETLKWHISKENPYGKYLTPRAQNEFILCCEQEIRKNILKRCEQSPFFSVMADECTDCSNQAQLSICIRYIYEDNKTSQVTEDFCGFIELKSTDAKTISNCILENLRKWGFNLANLRGQGYDGCSTMSGEVSGVKTRIIEQLPNAKYFVHCRSHCLNLVIVNSCQNIPVVRNFMAILGKITWFINGSSKRKNIMKSTLDLPAESNLEFDMLYDEEERVFDQEKRCLPTLSETRWTSRVDTLTWLLKHYTKVLDILQEIENKTVGHSDATVYSTTLQNFEILQVAVVTQFVLGYIRPLSIALQSVNCDLVEAHTQARLLVTTMTVIRTNYDKQFHDLFQRASAIATENEITVKPRTAGRQRHRANAAAETVEEHFRINLFIPFIDHVISHLNSRFPEEVKPVLFGFYLMPRFLQKLNDDIVEIIMEEYRNDIPFPDDFQQELHRWRNFVQRSQIPESYSVEAVLSFTSDYYPNIRRIMQLLLCIPVGSCCCERSFSALRRLKTWIRSTMTESRLCGLSMLQIHRSDDVGDIDKSAVLKRWDASGHRKIELAFDVAPESEDL
ncbi:52 kDa repressor of the inhibitor of the protein kinase-like [Ostrea edulis]|uniref:52 kDa repressor of the inhibitor of the protein kinase-like n=1 Tax=Ostrea edulis TaxID=37623 RepID=UPI0024AFB83E|nr:52 kDa repressor of the inhibitor of the protein kinase-like [Ostrea edulis]